ncbi:tRNA pseudouridine(38-40) synthase TruA [Robertkochia marina]|uniref:tRNA pseudouridine synthase A n=1 Tax=Robertkochia marina TaxID=1227945 RepID=A0A4V3UXX2_9FLAO|nr:tRNA pseudouridine(38-40) synthase TruA [Robertkochia marina]THD66424.1 tRNA pseudouridine(38-40) synthase TruA [Robertkochia marina]TRZ44101.1 tRNA pseudouridine(38-40) synthase TruA [Robertkochia marina]
MRYFVEFSYHGKAYHGWQRQPNATSVQEILERAFSLLLRQPLAVTGAGRTDAGVHASMMVAHFDTDHPVDMEDLTYRLNRFLPGDIAVHRIYRVQPDAHARFDATSRSYEYHLVQEKSPFLKDLAYEYRAPLDVSKMNSAAALLMEYEDFECFSRSKTDVKTYFCKISRAEWEEVSPSKLIFHITADRFLRNMVRAVVGTLLQIGEGKLDEEGLRRIIMSKNRSEAGASVPAHGLYLTDVSYPKTILKTNE